MLGLATTFTVTVAGFASVIDGIGLGNGTLRTLAVIALLGFGAALLVPRLADRLEAPLSRLARFGPRSRGGYLVRVRVPLTPAGVAHV